MTTRDSAATAATVHRSRPFLAGAVVASLLGSSIAWAVTLWMAPLSAYEVSLHIDDGRFAIVLDRRAPAERTPRHGDPAMNDGDGLHDEHVVTVATLDEYSTADSARPTKVCVPTVIVTTTIDVLRLAAPTPSTVSSRAGPLHPASFSILRI